MIVRRVGNVKLDSLFQGHVQFPAINDFRRTAMR